METMANEVNTTKRRAVRAEPLLMRLPVEQIGGGRVVRQFRMGNEIIKVGTELDADFIKQMPEANRRILLDRFIAVWPKAPEGAVSPPAAVGAKAERTERHVVPLGFGKFTVIEGVKICGKVTKAEAYEIAGKKLES